MKCSLQCAEWVKDALGGFSSNFLPENSLSTLLFLNIFVHLVMLFLNIFFILTSYHIHISAEIWNENAGGQR